MPAYKKAETQHPKAKSVEPKADGGATQNAQGSKKPVASLTTETKAGDLLRQSRIPTANLNWAQRLRRTVASSTKEEEEAKKPIKATPIAPLVSEPKAKNATPVAASNSKPKPVNTTKGPVKSSDKSGDAQDRNVVQRHPYQRRGTAAGVLHPALMTQQVPPASPKTAVPSRHHQIQGSRTNLSGRWPRRDHQPHSTADQIRLRTTFGWSNRVFSQPSKQIFMSSQVGIFNANPFTAGPMTSSTAETLIG